MRLDQIWMYPVKSMLGSRVPSAALAKEGIVGDREWTLRDEQRGAIASARRVGGISQLAASFTDGPHEVVVTLPDGSMVASGDRDANERLSAAVQHPVSLWRKPSATNKEFWAHGKPDNADIMTELRTIMGRVDDEPLPDFSIFPSELLEYEYPPGTLFDCFPLMIMTTSALRSLRRALPDSAIDERRFRPSLVVDTGATDGHPEFDWRGRRLRIGEAELEIGAGCPRCVTITRAFAEDLPSDRRVLRYVVKNLDQNVGVYATVVISGSVTAGDNVEVL